MILILICNYNGFILPIMCRGKRLKEEEERRWIKLEEDAEKKPLEDLQKGEEKGESSIEKNTTNDKSSFPLGCHWECYLDRNPDLIKGGVPQTEEAAFAHYVNRGAKVGRNCRCIRLGK